MLVTGQTGPMLVFTQQHGNKKMSSTGKPIARFFPNLAGTNLGNVRVAGKHAAAEYIARHYYNAGFSDADRVVYTDHGAQTVKHRGRTYQSGKVIRSEGYTLRSPFRR